MNNTYWWMMHTYNLEHETMVEYWRCLIKIKIVYSAGYAVIPCGGAAAYQGLSALDTGYFFFFFLFSFSCAAKCSLTFHQNHISNSYYDKNDAETGLKILRAETIIVCSLSFSVYNIGYNSGAVAKANTANISTKNKTINKTLSKCFKTLNTTN